MTDRPAVYSRIQRRETHASRATPAIVVAVVLILALAWLVAEVALAAAQQRPLLLAPAQMVQDIAGLGSVPVVGLAVAGAVLAILGILLVVAALAKGRRPRHVLHDEVVASALVRAAADTADIDPDRAVGSVSARTATVRVTPTSGRPVDRAAVESVLADRLQDWGLAPRLRARLRLQDDGRVGA